MEADGASAQDSLRWAVALRLRARSLGLGEQLAQSWGKCGRDGSIDSSLAVTSAFIKKAMYKQSQQFCLPMPSLHFSSHQSQAEYSVQGEHFLRVVP